MIDTEEKGSDVNLSTYLLLGAFEGDYEQAVVISNDSDFVLPIKLVSEPLKLRVGVVYPNVGNHRSAPNELTDAARFTRRLRRNALRDCQFPNVLTDAQGVITKPASW